MIAKILLIIIFLFLSCKGNETQKFPPKVVKGVLDLRSVETFRETSLRAWDFEKDGAINLDGEWEFYWKEFLEPYPVGDAYMRHLQDTVQYITVPGYWNNFEANGNPVGSQGYATYRMQILLPEMGFGGKDKTFSAKGLALKLPTISTAYRLYANGSLVTEVGKVGKSQAEYSPFFFPKFVLLPVDQKTIELVFHISNFQYYEAGLWNRVILGRPDDLYKSRDQNLFLDFFLFGALLLIGFYHLGIYSLRKKDSSILYFGLFCVLMALRSLLTGEFYWYQFFQNLPWELGIRLEYLTVYIGGPIFLSFLKHIFSEEFPNWSFKFILYSCLFFSLSEIFLPVIFFTSLLQLMQALVLFSLAVTFYTMFAAIREKREGAYLFLIGFIVFAFTITNDILYGNRVILTGYFAPFGFLSFVFSQSFFLSQRFSRAFAQVEELSQTLEQKVEERTKDLEETKKQIEDLNSFTHLVNSLSNLNDIFIEVSKYIYRTYNISAIWLFLPDAKKQYLYAYKTYSYERLPEDKYNYLMNKEIPMRSYDGGMLYKTYERKKPLYMNKISKFEFEIDKQIVETLSIKSFLYVPLIRKGESVGVLGFSNFEKEMKLSKTEIRKISTLCSQIAGSIDAKHLLEQVHIAKREIEKINSITRQINSESELNHILEFIFKYLEEEFGMDGVIVMLKKETEDILYTFNTTAPNVDQKKIDYSRKLSIPLTEKDGGLLYKVFYRKKTFYLSKIDYSDLPNNITGEMLKTLEYNSFLGVPLVLQNEAFGLILLTSYSRESKLDKTEIKRIENFCEHVTGAIYNSLLLKKAEEAKKEIERLAESRKRLSLIGEMASGIVHDIKNPMGTIKAFADLTLSPEISLEERSEYTSLILREIDRLSDMTFEILDFSKGKLNLDFEEHNVPEFLNEIYNFLRIDFEYANIKFLTSSDYDGNLVFDKNRIRRVLVNMVNNAREAMSESNKAYEFQIIITKESDGIIIALTDNGPGLPPRVEEKIFEAFTTEGKANGTGLGLFMSKWIVEQHNGKLTYVTKKDKGTTFFVFLPFRDEKEYNI